MIAPSGQRLLRAMPATQIICAACYYATRHPGDTVDYAGTVEEIKNEVRAARPNQRRRD
jgi:hypothetical protein